MGTQVGGDQRRIGASFVSTTRSTRLAIFLSFSIILVSSGGGGQAPDALAFQGEADGTDTNIVRRPVGNPCASSDYSVSFDASVALATSEAPAVGPFTISLPDGVYDVTVSRGSVAKMCHSRPTSSGRSAPTPVMSLQRRSTRARICS